MIPLYFDLSFTAIWKHQTKKATPFGRSSTISGRSTKCLAYQLKTLSKYIRTWWTMMIFFRGITYSIPWGILIVSMESQIVVRWNESRRRKGRKNNRRKVGKTERKNNRRKTEEKTETKETTWQHKQRRKTDRRTDKQKERWKKESTSYLTQWGILIICNLQLNIKTFSKVMI